MTHPPATAPYGSWASPITAQLIAAAGVALGGLQAVGEHLFWLELRPREGGRTALVRRDPDGLIDDVTPAGVNVRTMVHEYGGGSYTLFARPGGGLTLLYSEFADQRLYRLDLDGSGAAAGEPRPITPEPPRLRSLRYADGVVTPDGRTLLCVRERHEADEVINELVALPTDGSAEARVVASGHDFYAAPRLSPDGRRLAWLSWDHPAMPWDATELWLADLTAAGELAAQRRVAGGAEESVVQPTWSPDGRLHFASDRSDWWNLYRLDEEDGPADVVTALAPADAELARPSWVFGLQNYVFRADGGIVAFFTRDGADHLCVIDAPSGRDGALPAIRCPLTTIASLALHGDTIAAVAGSPTRSMAVVLVDPAGGDVTELRSSTSAHVESGYLSVPEAIEFPTGYAEGSVAGPLLEELGHGSLIAHALYYAPANGDFVAPQGERPPLIVVSHGGPTSSTVSALTLSVQFWTSRGFAVVDVDYGGSSGYGRRYRERLKSNWGVVDTVDCINAARYLVRRGDVDPDRLAVRGGSAGGYTTLNALTRHDVFAAGASYFGLADLEAFGSGGTHKFESRYLDGLVGPYPEAAELYRERSPINHVSAISCPVILFQGLEDAIVPPEQAEIIVAALERKGLPHAYLAFEGEQHGFRTAGALVRTLEAELYFYGRVFGFTPAGDIEPVEIKNLD